MWTFEFDQSFFKKVTLAGLDSLRQKRVPKFSLIFYDSANNYIYFKHQNKVIFLIKLLDPRTWLTLKNPLVIFLASETYAASLTSAASETLMASMTSKALFPQKTSWFWWFHSHWAPKWPILVPFWGLDPQKSKFLHILGIFSVRGCRGQPTLLFWK